MRTDYEEGGRDYWSGQPPRETDWRERRVAPPPPSGVEPTIEYLRQLLANERPPWPECGPARPV